MAEARTIGSATDARYTEPPPTTPDGEIVLYRMAGDCWQVAREPSEVEHLVGLGRAARICRRIEVLLVREAPNG